MFRIRPWADQAARQLAVRKLRRLIRLGRYQVPAELVAEAFLAEAGLDDADSSSRGGSDADAT